MADPKLTAPTWFCPQAATDGEEFNNISILFQPDLNLVRFQRDTCHADYIAFLLHLVFTCLSLLGVMIMSCYYRTKDIKHTSYTKRYPLHIYRWLLYIPFLSIMLASVTEGILSDMKLDHSTTAPSLYLPSLLASIAGLMTMVYYHHMEVWNQASMVMLLFVYWIGALGCEVLRFYKWLGNPDHVDVRIMRFDCFIITLVVYASFLLVESLTILIQVQYF